jgi:hypothetical protein
VALSLGYFATGNENAVAITAQVPVIKKSFLEVRSFFAVCIWTLTIILPSMIYE